MNLLAARQQPPAGSLFLDHVAHFVRDLNAAARALEAVGLAITPAWAQFTRDTRGAVQLTGISSRCVMLEAGYLELLAPVDETPDGNALRIEMARHAGVHLASFGTPSAAEEHARLGRHGFAPRAPLKLEREADVDGAQRTALFDVVRVPPEKMPEGRIQFAQQLTPECLWQPRYLARANGTLALAAVFVVADDPVAVAARYARFLALLPGPAGAWVRLETSRGAVLIGSAAHWQALLGSAPPAAPALAGYALACRDPRLLVRGCERAGIALRAAGAGLHAAQLPANLGGSWLFGEADALARFASRGLPVQ